MANNYLEFIYHEQKTGMFLGSTDVLTASSHDFDFTTGSIPAGMTFTRAATTNGASYFNSSGVMNFAGTDVARFDYDPSALTLRGLLYEPSATNYLKYSQDFSNGNWVVTVNGDMIRIGCKAHTAAEWNAFTDVEIDKMDTEALGWWKYNKEFVLALHKHANRKRV